MQRFAAAAVASLTLLVSSCAPGDQIVSIPVLPAGQQYTATGAVVEHHSAGKPPTWCQQFDPSNPAACTGLKLLDWSWETTPNKVTTAEATWVNAVTFTGQYQPGTFKVTAAKTTSVANQLSADVSPTLIDQEPGCTATPQATATTPTESTQTLIDQGEKLISELENDPSPQWYSHSWLSQQDDQVTLTVASTADDISTRDYFKGRWAGPLCVTQAQTSFAESQKIAQSIRDYYRSNTDLDQTVLVDVTVVDGVATLNALVDDGTIQNALDDHFGAAAVYVDSDAVPVIDH